MTIQFHEKEKQELTKNVKDRLPAMSEEMKMDVYNEVIEAEKKGLAREIAFELLSDTTGYAKTSITKIFYKTQRKLNGGTAPRVATTTVKKKQTEEEKKQKQREYAAKWYEKKKALKEQAKLEKAEVEQTALPLEEEVVEEAPMIEITEPKEVIEETVEEAPKPSVSFDNMGMATMMDKMLDRIEKLTQERDHYKGRAENAEAKNKRLIKLLDVEV
jgi:hypothetical protein